MKKHSLRMVILGLAICSLVALPAYANNVDQATAVNNLDQAVAFETNLSDEDLAKTYHQLFDLNSIQKEELIKRGYSEKDFTNIDSDDFRALEATWKLSADLIPNVKILYPELQEIDISNWTNSDFETYSITQSNKLYAPSAEQTAELQRRGISLDVASKMLKEYHSYDTLLSQPDFVLDELKNKIVEIDKEYSDYVNYKQAIKENYKANLK